MLLLLLHFVIAVGVPSLFLLCTVKKKEGPSSGTPPVNPPPCKKFDELNTTDRLTLKAIPPEKKEEEAKSKSEVVEQSAKNKTGEERTKYGGLTQAMDMTEKDKMDKLKDPEGAKSGPKNTEEKKDEKKPEDKKEEKESGMPTPKLSKNATKTDEKKEKPSSDKKEDKPIPAPMSGKRSEKMNEEGVDKSQQEKILKQPDIALATTPPSAVSGKKISGKRIMPTGKGPVPQTTMQTTQHKQATQAQLEFGTKPAGEERIKENDTQDTDRFFH